MSVPHLDTLCLVIMIQDARTSEKTMLHLPPMVPSQ
jgi:hypothetical protein